jgi:hypothetical protein
MPANRAPTAISDVVHLANTTAKALDSVPQAGTSDRQQVAWVLRLAAEAAPSYIRLVDGLAMALAKDAEPEPKRLPAKRRR